MVSQLEVIAQADKYQGMMNRLMSEVMATRTKVKGLVYRDGALPRKVKELIGMGIGCRAGCDSCMLHHAQGAMEAGATVEEVLEALSVVVCIYGGNGTAQAQKVVQLLDEMGKI